MAGLDPVNSGWTSEAEDSFNIKLQDKTDEFYTLPKDILHGCQCKGDCTTGRCSCNRVPAFSRSYGLNCCRWTCRCNCFGTEGHTVDPTGSEDEDELSSEDDSEQWISDLLRF